MIDTTPHEPRWAAGLRLLADACQQAEDAAQARRDAALAAGDAEAAEAALVQMRAAERPMVALRTAAQGAQHGTRWAEGWPAQMAAALRALADAVEPGP